MSASPLLRTVIEGEHYSVSKPRAAGRGLGGAGECRRELVAPAAQNGTVPAEEKGFNEGLALSHRTPQTTQRPRPAPGASCKAAPLRLDPAAPPAPPRRAPRGTQSSSG